MTNSRSPFSRFCPSVNATRSSCPAICDFTCTIADASTLPTTRISVGTDCIEAAATATGGAGGGPAARGASCFAQPQRYSKPMLVNKMTTIRHGWRTILTPVEKRLLDADTNGKDASPSKFARCFEFSREVESSASDKVGEMDAVEVECCTEMVHRRTYDQAVRSALVRYRGRAADRHRAWSVHAIAPPNG